MRGTILAAAKDLWAETGDKDAVSVRAIAERVGVTTPSIYMHFRDKDDLIDAVCAELFAGLSLALEDAAARATGPLDRLYRQGHAYIDFALANADQYRAVFVNPGGPKNADDVISERCFIQLLETVAICTEAGIFPPSAAGPVPVAMQLFCSVHGIVSLLLNKPWLPWGTPDEAVERALKVAVAGCALMPCLDAPDDVATARLQAVTSGTLFEN